MSTFHYQETYGTYAELRHDADTMLAEPDQSRPHDILAQRDYLDTVCRSYATRLERRRNLIIAACRFYRHAELVSYASRVMSTGPLAWF